MNSFLTRQAMRVLDPGYGVRPRVPARFEPSGYEASQFVEHSVVRGSRRDGTTEEAALVEDPASDHHPLDRNAAVITDVPASLPTRQPAILDESQSPVGNGGVSGTAAGRA